MDKARERGGIVIGSFVVADNAKNNLAGMLASASAALSGVSSPGTDASELLTACARARSQGKQLKSDIQVATAATTGQLEKLKKGYEDTTNARKKACQESAAANGASDVETCEQHAAQAKAQASDTREAAQATAQTAGKMKSLYDSLKSNSVLKSFDELLRKIPAAIKMLENQITSANER